MMKSSHPNEEEIKKYFDVCSLHQISGSGSSGIGTF